MDKQTEAGPGVEPELVRLARAIDRAIGASSAQDLARELSVHPSTVGRWRKAENEPSIVQVRRMEDALGLPRGTIYRDAGAVECPVDVPSAIAMDLDLTPDGRRVMLDAYRGLARSGSAGD